VEAMEMAKMAPGALPCLGRVPEQSLLSPKIGLRRRWCCGTLLVKTPTDLGFRLRRVLKAERRCQSAARGPTPPPGAAKGGATPWCGGSLAPPPALLRSSSRVREK
jgi:hypothetical protein